MIDPQPIRLIAERSTGGRDWSVQLEDEPRRACGGATIETAVKRWLTLNADRFVGPYAVSLDEHESTLDRRVLLLRAATRCPDCNGRGEYVGLVVVETCRACGGTGVVMDSISDV